MATNTQRSRSMHKRSGYLQAALCLLILMGLPEELQHSH
jgi:hypothetical protein